MVLLRNEQQKPFTAKCNIFLQRQRNLLKNFNLNTAHHRVAQNGMSNIQGRGIGCTLNKWRSRSPEIHEHRECRGLLPLLCSLCSYLTVRKMCAGTDCFDEAKNQSARGDISNWIWRQKTLIILGQPIIFTEYREGVFREHALPMGRWSAVGGGVGSCVHPIT